MSTNGHVPRAGDGRGARMLIDGEWIGRDEIIEVANPFDARIVDTVPRGRAGDIKDAVSAAVHAAGRPWPAHARYEILTRAAGRSSAERTRQPVRTTPPRLASRLASARVIVCEPPFATGQSSTWAVSAKTRPSAEVAGCDSGSTE